MTLLATVLLWLGSEALEPRPLPDAKLAGFTGTEARSLDDFLGQPLLIDFFAHWCAPCARLVPHVNELVDAYGEQGLNVLGVTGDDAPTAAEWLERFEARYPHALDTDLRLQIELGFRPLPFSVLVDPFGVIVWQGSPADVPMETIEALLESAAAVPVHRWPAAASTVRDALRSGEYARARTLAAALQERGAEIARFVERLVARHVELLDAAVGREDWLGADELAAGLEAGADGVARSHAAEMRKTTAATPAAQVVLGAQRALRELWATVGSVGTVAQADELAAKVHALAEAHPGTQVERTAQAHLETIAALKTILQ